ncbi:MAG: precorrin-3B C(17)-methyltransferase [Lachnospiraceae bacterium]|nr:precorrin-3B C(17)-methyltransferase [Lachnospiraceae bacterium]
MRGRLFVVGIGPGNKGCLTFDALKALDEAELVVGYEVYINIIKKLYEDIEFKDIAAADVKESMDTGDDADRKLFYSTGMGGETDRCRYALSEAYKGKKVALVCSGDSGIYGMAGLIYRLDAKEFANAAENKGQVDITIIPGVTAALSGAAMLGSPIGNDFAVISLSTALTPWEDIALRLQKASEGDFAIVIYNPMSRTRPYTLRDACDIISEYTGAGRIAGYVRNIGRDAEEHAITTVGELRDTELDMFATVFIGNSDTVNINEKMITGRKYRI